MGGDGFQQDDRDDYAAILSELELQLDERRLRAALGVGERELDLMRIGHEPSGEVAERLRLLRDLGRSADLSDPEALAAALLGSRGGPAAYLALFRRPWLILGAFLALDALVVVAVLAYLFLVS